MTDEEIIALFNARSEQAIEAISHKYGSLVRTVLQNILHNTQDVEECLSDTWLGVWNSVPPQHPDPLKTYVCRIARNLGIGRYHKNTAQCRNSSYDVALSDLADCLAAIETTESGYGVRELTRSIDQFLDTVSYDDRYMFVRRYWYADAVTEIARQMHMTPHRVTVRLGRIRSRLQKYLQKQGLL